MFLRTLALALLLVTPLVSVGDTSDHWILVRSPHFTVATNAGEKQGRRIAAQFERVRSLFHAALPELDTDTPPIAVLAVKDERDFRTLEPEEYLAKESLRLSGLFLQIADKNYVLLRLDAEGDHPYSTIYHEYSHFLMRKSADWMPLWLSEGLAEFYENTEIHEKDASLGEASAENLVWLRQHRLVPLATLFAIDRTSPYYHDEKKGSIFYAESWALTHYIQMNDFPQKAHRLNEYSELLVQNADPVTAATRVFGDLSRLQSNLEMYIRQERFLYIKVPAPTEVVEPAFNVHPLTLTESEALRADFLASIGRTADAQALLDLVLREDPKNVSALETKGLLAFQQGHVEEAKKWYEQAVQLDSQNYLAHYYFAAMSMIGNGDPSQQERVETSLRAAIKLNPSFAPAYDRLAILLTVRQKSLEEARTMGVTAVSLDPTNVGYRINVANILMTTENPKSALEVLRAAARVAKNPEQRQIVAHELTRAQQYADAHAQSAAPYGFLRSDFSGDNRETVGEKTAGSVPTVNRRPDFVAKGAHRFTVGVLKSVSCNYPTLDLTVVANGEDLSLHSENYFKIPFTAIGFQPVKTLNPCTDLEKRSAKVEYLESADPNVTARLVSVELHK